MSAWSSIFRTALQGLPQQAMGATEDSHAERSPGCGIWGLRRGRLTSPVRLGLLLTEEATELMELREEAEGLRFRLAGVVAITRLTAAALALAGVVEGKPIFVTLWTGANNPYLG